MKFMVVGVLTSVLLAASGDGPSSAKATPGARWEKLPDMPQQRSGEAVVFAGRWIFVGGASDLEFRASSLLDRVDSYDPVSHTWQSLPKLSDARAAMAVASDEAAGRIMISGGSRWVNLLPIPTKVAEVGPPDARALTTMNKARSSHTLTLVNGEFLAAGGWAPALLDDAEVFNSSGQWEPVGHMPGGGRAVHTSTALAGTTVALVAGGSKGSSMTTTCDLFDFATRRWKVTGALHHPRAAHQALQLADGRVLVTGGIEALTVLSSVELYDPATGAWTDGEPMHSARQGHVMIRLPDGRVLVAGGTREATDREPGTLTSVELYDPTTNTWTEGPPLNARRAWAVGALLQDAVYIAGGADDSDVLASMERLRLTDIPPVAPPPPEPSEPPSVDQPPVGPVGGGGCTMRRGLGRADAWSYALLALAVSALRTARRVQSAAGRGEEAA